MENDPKVIDEETVKRMKAEALDLETKISNARKKLKDADSSKDESAIAKRLEKLEGDLTSLRDEIRALKPAAAAAVPAKSWTDEDWDD